MPWNSHIFRNSVIVCIKLKTRKFAIPTIDIEHKISVCYYILSSRITMYYIISSHHTYQHMYHISTASICIIYKYKCIHMFVVYI